MKKSDWLRNEKNKVEEQIKYVKKPSALPLQAIPEAFKITPGTMNDDRINVAVSELKLEDAKQLRRWLDQSITWLEMMDDLNKIQGDIANEISNQRFPVL